MKTHDEFITDVAPIWLEMFRADAPRELVEKFSEDELRALSEYLVMATYQLYAEGAEHGYSNALMDNILERDETMGREA